MYCRINELRELLIRLVFYSATRDIDAVGSTSREIFNLLSVLQDEFYDLRHKIEVLSDESDESELDDSCEPF